MTVVLTARCRESSLLQRQLSALERENEHLKDRLVAAADVLAAVELECARHRRIASQHCWESGWRSDRF